MRLICPNCDAQYEVSDDAIPPEGRDVQCSNCGHGWFHRPVSLTPASEAEHPVPLAPPPEAAPPSPASVPHPAAPLPPLPDEEEEDAGFPEPAPVAPPSRSLDKGLLAVLREEAELAARQREAEVTGPPAMRPEPAPEPAPSAAPAAPPPPEPALAEPMPRPRRDLLPDIEEINSSLRSNAARPAEDLLPAPAPVRPSRAAHRAGFFLMIFAALMLALAYVMAPRIAAEIPGAEPALRRYVAGVDEARLLLDRLLRAAADQLRGGA
ncbi:zinc-ribbon domain-containing protein [Cereibacter sediminicola]|uniref:zinc-ribbon domain-containing protein n=1 Tax=Cereibacter sediminicola TaxID=2584941 RepID=UPI00119E1149|nr:zinc-ribbon domain-containing protein [Cereibacter sediminicola]